MDLFRQIGGSALVDESIAVPALSTSQASFSGRTAAEIPVTYVPFRNAHFLSAAVSWAEVIGAAKVYIGAVEQDSSGYPDCRPAFYQAFQLAVDRGTRAGGITLETPLIGLRKSEIVQRGIALNAPLDLTWSCYTGEAAACGVCESCVLRLRAFAQAGVEDPIAYAGH
jgi:7-cyano-7-deazaguanine synthase